MTASDFIAQRKDDHIALALQQQSAYSQNEFDLIRFVHHSLSPLTMEDIHLTTYWAKQQHLYPFYINAMTGGSARAAHYNEQLSLLARETQLAIASGSVSAAIRNPEVHDTYSIMRHVNPTGFIMANLGAHHSVESAKKAIALLDANALQIHLNIPQEIAMPEGDRDFSQWLTNIEAIVKHIEQPIIVKEVGFGMSQHTMRQLADIGVTTIDISGRGGTNFIQIEDTRNQQFDHRPLYNYGQSTPEALLEALAIPASLEILASGGIRHPFDMMKSLALGAKSVGIAGPLLAHLEQYKLEATIELVDSWQTLIKQYCLMLGSATITELEQTDLILSGTLREWAIDRQLPYQQLAHRRTGKMI